MEQIFYAAYKNLIYFLVGFDLINYLKAIFIFLVFLFFSRLLTKYILTWMQNLAIKNQQDFLAKTFQSLQEPLRAFLSFWGWSWPSDACRFPSPIRGPSTISSGPGDHLYRLVPAAAHRLYQPVPR
jgi:hypothetical protein